MALPTATNKKTTVAIKTKKVPWYDKGHLKVSKGTLLDGRYRICKQKGKGAFSKVLECEDLKSFTTLPTGERVPQKVAIKILRLDQNVYAREEIAILKDVRLKQALTGVDAKCIRLLNAFTYKGHYCMVFPVYPMCLKTFLDLQEDERGLPMKLIKKITYDLLTGVEFLHKNNIIHTDIKLENILVKNMEEGDVALIDFGSALYSHDEHEEIITTSHYRSPEVILGIGWDQAVDLWAIGCIMFELLSGDLMFNPKNKAEHLGTIEHYLGAIPAHIGQGVTGKTRKYFDSNGRLMWPEIATKKSHERYVESLDSIETEILLAERYNNATKTESGLFYDLLLKLVTIDPAKRITAAEALRHQFLEGEREHDEARRRAQVKDKLIKASEIAPSSALKRSLEERANEDFTQKCDSNTKNPTVDVPKVAEMPTFAKTNNDPVHNLGLSPRVSTMIKTLDDQDDINKILDKNALEEANATSPHINREERVGDEENDIKRNQDGSLEINWDSEDESGDTNSVSTSQSGSQSRFEQSIEVNQSITNLKSRPTPIAIVSSNLNSPVETPKSMPIISAERDDLEDPIRTKKMKTKHRKPNHRTPALTSVKKESRTQKKKKIAVRRRAGIGISGALNSPTTYQQGSTFANRKVPQITTLNAQNRSSPIPSAIGITALRRPSSSLSNYAQSPVSSSSSSLNSLGLKAPINTGSLRLKSKQLSQNPNLKISRDGRANDITHIKTQATSTITKQSVVNGSTTVPSSQISKLKKKSADTSAQSISTSGNNISRNKDSTTSLTVKPTINQRISTAPSMRSIASDVKNSQKQTQRPTQRAGQKPIMSSLTSRVNPSKGLTASTSNLLTRPRSNPDIKVPTREKPAEKSTLLQKTEISQPVPKITRSTKYNHIKPRVNTGRILTKSMDSMLEDESKPKPILLKKPKIKKLPLQKSKTSEVKKTGIGGVISKSKYNLRLRTPEGQKSIVLDSETTFGEFLDKVKELLCVDKSMTIKVKQVFPPQYISNVDNASKLGEIKSISPNDTLVIEVAKEQDSFEGKQRISPSNYSKIPQKPKAPYAINPVGTIVKRSMPPDNSCLFHSISYCLQGSSARKHSEYPTELRKVIADNVANEPVKFTEAFLGQKPLEYQKFILQKDSWGGGIELAILSHFYKIEICAFNMQTGKAVRFGEAENYDAMIFVIYNGVHYDSLAVSSESDERYDTTVFSTKSYQTFQMAERFTQNEIYRSGSMKLDGLSLRCTICNTVVDGEYGARIHLEHTGHDQYGPA